MNGAIAVAVPADAGAGVAVHLVRAVPSLPTFVAHRVPDDHRVLADQAENVAFYVVVGHIIDDVEVVLGGYRDLALELALDEDVAVPALVRVVWGGLSGYRIPERVPVLGSATRIRRIPRIARRVVRVAGDGRHVLHEDQVVVRYFHSRAVGVPEATSRR